MSAVLDHTTIRIALLGPCPSGLGEYAQGVQPCDTPTALAAVVRRGRVDVVLIAEESWPDAERMLAGVDPSLSVLRHEPGAPFGKGLLQQAAALRRQRREAVASRHLLAAAGSGVCVGEVGGSGLVGESDAMAGLRARLRQVGESSGPITIAGAAGTPLLGACRALHALGGGPLLHIDLRQREAMDVLVGVASLPLIDLATDGTLVLEHVDAAQGPLVELLVDLAEGCWAGPGDGPGIQRPVRCRLIGTVERDPALPGTVAIASGMPPGWVSRVVRVPALVERRVDLPVLIASQRDPATRDADPGVDADYEWPGNDRELELRCTLAALTAAALPSTSFVCDGTSTLADLERQAVVATLRSQGGHRRRTAEALGIGLRTLGVKLSQWRSARLLPPGV